METQIFSQTDAPKVARRDTVDRSITRYIVCMSDHIEKRDKNSLPGKNIGGVRVSTYPSEGCPTLVRTAGMVYRGAIIPLELTVIQKRADQRAETRNSETYIAGTTVRGQEIYPGDDLSFLLGDHFTQFGFREVEALRGQEWSSGFALDLHRHFFPNWYEWLENGGAPVLLDDWISYVNKGMENTDSDVVISVGTAYLDSAAQFRVNALDYIEKNKQLIQSKRNNDSGGFFVNWSGRARLYAEQLGIGLEDEVTLRDGAKESPSSELLEQLMRERSEDIKLLLQQNDIMREMFTAITGDIVSKKAEPEVAKKPATETAEPEVKAPKKAKDAE